MLTRLCGVCWELYRCRPICSHQLLPKWILWWKRGKEIGLNSYAGVTLEGCMVVQYPHSNHDTKIIPCGYQRLYTAPRWLHFGPFGLTKLASPRVGQLSKDSRWQYDIQWRIVFILDRVKRKIYVNVCWRVLFAAYVCMPLHAHYWVEGQTKCLSVWPMNAIKSKLQIPQQIISWHCTVPLHCCWQWWS